MPKTMEVLDIKCPVCFRDIVIARQGSHIEFRDTGACICRVSIYVRQDVYHRRIAQLAVEAACPTCISIRENDRGFGPRHYGSPYCESGSLASGGNRPHCTCDLCF